MLKCKAHNYGSYYLVLKNGEKQNIETNMFVLDAMHDEVAVVAMEAYYEALKPSDEKVLLKQWLDDIKEHWEDVYNDKDNQ